ncbi:hypothetical protein SEA_MOAB_112 [Streptomyces phage Moab]|nr:hypothetical protein SEA_MOAB_112 [Streptomyces phage Moab]
MERKLVIYYESSDTIDEDALFEHVHRFFCDNPNDQSVTDCPLYAMTSQAVVEEE